MDSLFTKIINRQIAADIVYEDGSCIVVRDTHPQAPVHLLLIPKKPIDRLTSAHEGDEVLLGHLLLVANRVARQLKIENGFRLILNNGQEAGQTVFHLHLHLLAGRPFQWPPG